MNRTLADEASILGPCLRGREGPVVALRERLSAPADRRLSGVKLTLPDERRISAVVESPGGISPPGAPRTVHDPLESHGSRCSAVAIERLCLVHRLLLFPVGHWPRPNNAAPSLQPHYRAFDATTGCSAPAPRFGTLALAVGAACGLSLHVLGRDEAQVLTFRTKAWSSFAPPTCRMPLGQSQASPELIPEEGSPPGFGIA